MRVIIDTDLKEVMLQTHPVNIQDLLNLVDGLSTEDESNQWKIVNYFSTNLDIANIPSNNIIPDGSYTIRNSEMTVREPAVLYGYR